MSVCSRGGAPLKFKTPADLYNTFEKYKKWAENNPWLKQEFIRTGSKAGNIIELKNARALTEWEFAAFCGLSYQGLRNYGEREDHKQFFDTYHRIKNEMSAFRVSGGLCDAFNANLVARIDGIKEQSAVEHDITDKLAERLSAARKRVQKVKVPDGSK